MICTNCYKSEYVTIECMKCLSCGDICFTHAQSIELDEKRQRVQRSKVVCGHIEIDGIKYIVPIDVCSLLKAVSEERDELKLKLTQQSPNNA